MNWQTNPSLSERVSAWFGTHRVSIGALCGALWAALSVLLVHETVWQILAGILGGMVFVLRTIRPGAALATAWLTAIAIMLPPGTILFFSIVVILVGLTAAAHFGGDGTKRAATISVPLGTVVATLHLSLSSNSQLEYSGPPYFIAAMVFIVLGSAWLLGTLGAARDRNRARLIEASIARRETAAERERANLARDMHDVIAHSLSVMVTLADGTRLSTPDLPEAASNSLRDIAVVGRHSLTEVRTLLARLRSPGSDANSSPGTIEAVIAAMQTAGMSVSVVVEGDGPPASTPIYQTITHLLRESLTNALRHGDMDQPVYVQVGWDEYPQLTVRNSLLDGTVRSDSGQHWGLLGMQERVALLGGTIQCGPIGRNWVVTVTLTEGE